MIHILKGTPENINKGRIKHTVDEKTVIIGKDTKNENVSKAETQRMLSEQLDTLPKGEMRSVYDKIWSGVKKYT